MRAIPQKIMILKFIGEQGIVTVSDVTRHLFEDEKFSCVRVIMHQLGIAHMKFREIPNGVWFIDNPELYKQLSLYFPDFLRFEVRSVVMHHIDHDLELNRIRTSFTRTHLITIDQWWSEKYIRALPIYLRRDFRIKFPDAIFWRKRHDGTSQKYFLEYERTMKSKERYENIFRSYVTNKEVKDRNVIYICADIHIKEELHNIEQNLVKSGRLGQGGEYFQFITLEGFYKTHSNNLIQKGEMIYEKNQTAYANV